MENFEEFFKKTIVEISENEMSDKGTGHAYEHIYPNLLKEYNGKVNNILEVGIASGGGLLMFSRAFPESKIYGIDRDLKQLRIDTTNTNITILPEMDQTKIDVSLLPMLDIIVEDAAHEVDLSMKTFELLEPKLNKNGIYIIEDIMGHQAQHYLNDKRFTVLDIRHIKNRHDDIVAIYRKM